MGADAIKVFAMFLRELQDVTPAWTGGSWVPDREQDAENWNARNLSDRTQALRGSFDSACEVFDLDPKELLAKNGT